MTRNHTKDPVEILIAEDSPTQAAKLHHLLSEHGYSVEVATNGKSALEAAQRHKPTLILSDVVMPELDGYGLCLAVKSDQRLRDVLVILVTTLADPRDVIRGLECGADSFIRKPYNDQYLLSRLEHLLRNLSLRDKPKIQTELKINWENEQYCITSGRRQMLDLLISIYEQAVQLNNDLQQREKQIAQSNQILNGLYRVAEGLNRASSEQEVVDRALQRILEIPGIQAGWIALRDGEGESAFRIAAARQLQEGDVHPGQMCNSCHCQHQLLTDELTSATHIRSCNRLSEHGPQSHTSVPIRIGNQALGVINLIGNEGGLVHDDNLKNLSSLGNQIGVALARARLHERLTLSHLQKDEQLNYLAYFDPITGLPNRALFEERLAQRLNTARCDQRAFSVIMLDIERFSEINETLGRQAGDELLHQFAHHIKHTLHDIDLLARLSNDCFGIVTGDGNESTDIAHTLEKILDSVQSHMFLVNDNELRITVKAGVASFPNDGHDADTLSRNAEVAMKKAKHTKEKYFFYTPEIHARVAERLTLENKLRQALKEQQLVLHYQPKVDLKEGSICGLEALLRWNDPEIGLVPPGKFISTLEETGMIFEAGRWALEEAISKYRQWQSQGLRPPRIAVNVSPIQLRDGDFVLAVKRAIESSAEDVKCLELEITESVLMQDIEANILKLKANREMGVTIAVDDFGTGYSSLSYIAKLPVNSLKIDRSFIINMAANPDDLSIVSTIISLAHSLNLRVVAEGVETEQQANLLRLLKCDEIQGYLISPPAPMEQIEHLLRERKCA